MQLCRMMGMPGAASEAGVVNRVMWVTCGICKLINATVWLPGSSTQEYPGGLSLNF